MNRLSGRTAIITGAARGQGAEHARRFVAEGATVVLGDVLEAELTSLGRELGDAAATLPLDVTQPADWTAALELAVRAFGDPSILVNNAGVLGRGALDEIDLEEFRRTLDINLTGPWLGLRSVGAHMKARGAGSIINIASIAGHRAIGGRGSYTASKWGLRGLSKAAALELGPYGVRVNTILPGYIDTPMLSGRRGQALTDPELWTGLALPRIGTPGDVADMAVFLASDESSYCTGGDFVVDAGASLGYVMPARPTAVDRKPG